jgi:hypothetical protein
MSSVEPQERSVVMSSNLEREVELDFAGEYVEHAAETVAAWLKDGPVSSREQALGRFQAANDVIWSPEIYHRVQAALDKLAPNPGARSHSALPQARSSGGNSGPTTQALQSTRF